MLETVLHRRPPRDLGEPLEVRSLARVAGGARVGASGEFPIAFPILFGGIGGLIGLMIGKSLLTPVYLTLGGAVAGAVLSKLNASSSA
jgi:hypothetical protein